MTDHEIAQQRVALLSDPAVATLFASASREPAGPSLDTILAVMEDFGEVILVSANRGRLDIRESSCVLLLPDGRVIEGRGITAAIAALTCLRDVARTHQSSVNTGLDQLQRYLNERDSAR
jgi:hypothetical protein